ncbi:MAG: helix-turn-helix domain-containing protein [Kiritimatiellia bacterium]
MNAVVKTPGQQLKEAREEVGKTLSELAKTTRIGVTQLQGLEADDYSKIPAPMYVRGFLKLYAKELGLRPEPLIDVYERMQRGGALLEKPDEPAAPAPVEDDPGFPGTDRPDRKPPSVKFPAIKLPGFRLDLQTLRSKLPDPAQILNHETLRSPRVRIAAAGAGVLLLLIVGLRSCGEDAPAAEFEVPEVEEPLLNPPDPVFFELPGSYQ